MKQELLTSERVAISERMTNAWGQMAQDNFALVKVYFGIEPERLKRMMRGEEVIKLPEDQKPVADYLEALRDYLQFSLNHNP